MRWENNFAEALYHLQGLAWCLYSAAVNPGQLTDFPSPSPVKHSKTMPLHLGPIVDGTQRAKL
jgi:hypothetical protein